MRNKKKNRIFLLLILLLGITLGYALISTTLKIVGNATLTKQTWNVYWGVPVVSEGSVSMTAPTRGADQDEPANTKLTWSVTLNLPGDFYEFEVDAVNEGTIDAMITGLEPTVTPALPEYIKYEVKYADGIEPALNHLLAKNTTERYKVRVYYDETVATRDTINNMTGDTQYTFTFNVTYGQATDEAIEKPSDAYFATDSWDKIISAYNNGLITQLTEDMNNGTTREVELDLDNDGTAETTGHLRIANLSTPSECETEGFSQTACGFVIEFSDIITTHRMNPYVNYGTSIGDGNKGGWEYSDMRAFINNKKYLEGQEGEIDYTGTGIYSSLPSDLRNKIIDTTVVSGHGHNDSANFTTIDRLYLFDVKEIYGSDYTSENNTANDKERQLDYYASLGLSISNRAGAIKKNLQGLNRQWWLRSAPSKTVHTFYNIEEHGYWYDYTYCTSPYGVSPAFRIAK